MSHLVLKQAHKQIEDVHAFEKSCGIGVVVSEAELKASIAKAIETNSAVLTERKVCNLCCSCAVD